VSIAPTYCASPPGSDRVTNRGLADEVRPLPLSTKSCEPSRENMAAVGYQPVGMNPSTSLCPGFATSITATVLLSALATSRRLSSGERLTWFGVDPGGACGNIDTEICSAARPVSRSIAHTALVFAQATKRRLPSFVSAIALGCSPTAISPRGSNDHASKDNTLAPPQIETNSVLPSGDTTHV